MGIMGIVFRSLVIVWAAIYTGQVCSRSVVDSYLFCNSSVGLRRLVSESSGDEVKKEAKGALWILEDKEEESANKAGRTFTL